MTGIIIEFNLGKFQFSQFNRQKAKYTIQL